MLKYLTTAVLISMSMTAMAADDPMLSAAPKVARHVIAGKTARDASNSELALEEFIKAYDLLINALEGDTTVDIEGSVGAGIFVDHVESRNYLNPALNFGRCTEEMIYDSRSPLSTRIANMAGLIAREGEKIGNHLLAAEYYGSAGDYHNGGAPAQIHYFSSAKAYASVPDPQKALEQTGKAEEVARRFWASRGEYICLLSSIAEFCLQQSEHLSDSAPEIASQFASKGKGLQTFMKKTD